MSFGEELRRERELRKISLREVAEATKINLRYLDALERNDFEHLPGGVFNKGFVRAYAQYIGVDPDAMVNAYLLEEQSQRSEDEAASPEPGELLRGPSRGAPAASRTPGTGIRRLPRALVWGGTAVLLVVALSTAGWFAARWWSARATAQPTGAPAQTHAPDGGRPGSTEPPARTSPDRQDSPAPGPTKGEEGNPKAEEAPERETEARLEKLPGQVPAPVPAEKKALSAEEGTRPAAAGSRFEVRLLRPAAGRVNCDNRRIEILTGLPAASRFTFECRRFLRVDVEDGGAVEVTPPGGRPAPVGEAGVPVEGRVYRPADGA